LLILLNGFVETSSYKLIFDPAAQEQIMDTLQHLTKLLVIGVTLDDTQGRT